MTMTDGLSAPKMSCSEDHPEAIVGLFAISGLTILLNSLVILSALVLMFIVLIQRGKGGGLAGALGGAGGSSAFGSRAGDQFTKITLYIAAFWLVFIMIQVKIAAAFDKPAPLATDTAVVAPPGNPAPALEPENK